MNKQMKSDTTEKVTLSPVELAQLGDGQVAYIKQLTASEAGRMFPAIAGIPKGIPLFALHAADGTPLALTDSKHAALTQAMDDELSIASVH